MPGHSKDHKYWFMGNNAFDEEFAVGADFLHARIIGVVEFVEEAENISTGNNDELVALSLEPLRFVAFVELCFCSQPRWRRRAHVSS
jgi:hypothetical protein